MGIKIVHIEKFAKKSNFEPRKFIDQNPSTWSKGAPEMSIEPIAIKHQPGRVG